jgi:hypothetical protein
MANVSIDYSTCFLFASTLLPEDKTRHAMVAILQLCFLQPVDVLPSNVTGQLWQ